MSGEHRSVRSLALELTKGCNLRCGYCYYADREDAYQPAERMTTEVAERSVELLFEQGPVDEPVHLHFFGGEPLLHFDLLEYAVLYAERRSNELGRAVTFEVTTNGTRFSTDVVAFLNRHEFQIGVSFDGPPEVQNDSRPSLGGDSSQLALPGIRRMLDSRRGTALESKTHCSVVVTRREPNMVRLVEYLEALGFHKVLLTPATDLDGREHGFREQDLPDLLQQYDRLAEDYEQRMRHGRPAVARWYETLMGRVTSGERRAQYCSGGRDYLGVAADGQLYLCYRFFENDEFSMGSVREGVARDVSRRLDEHSLESRAACSQCWARHYCGGGCHHDNVIRGGGLGDPNPVSCEILRHSMSRTLEMWARLRPAEPGNRPGPREEGEGMDGEREDFSAQDRPRRTTGWHVRELDHERIVYHPETHDVAVLNATAAFLLDSCDGEHTVEELLGRFVKRFDAPEEVLRRDLLATLRDLRARRLLTA